MIELLKKNVITDKQIKQKGFNMVKINYKPNEKMNS